MDKKQLLNILLLSIGVAIVAQYFIKKPQDKPAPKAPTDIAATAPADSAATRFVYGGKGVTDEQIDAGQVPSVRLGSLDIEDGYNFQLELDVRGASVRQLKLAGYFDTVKHKRKKDKTDQELQDWSYALLNAVDTGRPDTMVMPFSTQSVTINGVEIPTNMSPRVPISWAGADGKGGFGRIAWDLGEVTVDDDGAQRVSFTLNLYPDRQAAGESKPAYRLVKTYTVRKNTNSVDVALKVVNLTDEAQNIAIRQFGPAGVPREGLRRDIRDTASGVWNAGSQKVEVPKGRRILLTDAVKDEPTTYLGSNAAEGEEPILWASSSNQFFGCLVYPVPEGIDPASVTKSMSPADLIMPPTEMAFAFRSDAVGTGEENRSQLLQLTTQAAAVAPGAEATYEFDVYCGAKRDSTFKAVPLYERLGYSKAITFQSCTFCLFEPLALGVMWIIERGGAAIGNYGVIIILMVLLIRALLHPITKRSQVSMMKMKKLQPEMQRIQEKYKDNKEAMQKAMMEFWKETGASPFLGCLPMFLQMPIWIALWSGLSASVVLRHEGLLPFWITDLAGPDTVLTLAEPFNMPLIGPIVGLNILPLLLMVSMILQQKLQPMQSTPTSPEQAGQQKMMMFMLPAMMLVFFYNAPSGLTLYIMASTAGGVIESYFIRKHIREREAAEAAGQTVVTVPGRSPRGSRPKKPKPPKM